MLVLDADPSSIRFAVFPRAVAGAFACSLRGALTHLHGDARFRACDGAGRALADLDCADEAAPGHATALELLFNWLALHAADLSLRAVGHRLADDRGLFGGAVRLDAPARARLAAGARLEPGERAGLALVRLLAARAPRLPQIACFDSTFHATLPTAARTFDALTRSPPPPVGRHGLAYEDLIDRLAALDARAAGGRTVAVHLEGTVALCGLAAGRSVATTPDFLPPPPAEPGAPHGERPARGAARELFRYRLRREIGSLAAALGGLDAIVVAVVDAAASASLGRDVLREAAWLGVEPDRDTRRGPRLARPRSPVAAYLVEVDPARAVARHSFEAIAP